MKKTKTLLALLLALMFVLTIGFAACKDPKPEGPGDDSGLKDLNFTAGTKLRMATGYNNAQTGIAFDAKTAGDGITLADGNTYNTGDLKPTWKELETRLGMKFEDHYQGNKASDEWAYWKEQLDKIDMVSGTASDLNDAGVAGSLINIAEYLNVMPNFKAYLDANPIVRLSITGSTNGSTKGAIYFSPYFDGVNDIERMPLMRADMVKKILDDDTFQGENRAVTKGIYTPYMPTTGSYPVESLNADGTAKITITKDYSKAQNIIAQMNAAESLTGNQAIAMFRTYIDNMYGDVYTNRSDLFLGYNACWDADELVALLRCAVASFNNDDGKPISGLFARETNNVQREVDLFRFAGTLFGVRGLESRQDYLYIGKDGNLHDARQEAATYAAIDKMHAMYQEGLIVTMDNPSSDKKDYIKSETRLEMDDGIVSYDYSQTQTIYNGTKLNLEGDTGEEYTPAMVPVARWNDGNGEKTMRFTESWRSVKTDGWALSKAGIGNDENKLKAALKLIDYAYSEAGQILMSYGPDAFIAKKMDGSYDTFDFNGQQWPKIADATRAELMSKASGNYTNYARMYLGSTLSFVKSQSFEFECTHEVGRAGAGKISAAIKHGTIKHPELSTTVANKWYMSVPTVVPNTKQEIDLINTYTELTSNGKFSQSSGKVNVLLNIIKSGYTSVDGASNGAEMVTLVSQTWSGAQYLAAKQAAMTRLLNFYNEINK